MIKLYKFWLSIRPLDCDILHRSHILTKIQMEAFWSFSIWNHPSVIALYLEEWYVIDWNTLIKINY
jgi:hypothetical protein